MEALWILLIAVAIDVIVGEPSARLHPVVWMGRSIAFFEARAPNVRSNGQLLYGAALVLLGLLAWLLPLFLFLTWIARLGQPFPILVGAFLLKTTFSIRGLVQAALKVKRPLMGGNLEEARRLLGRHLVSRKTGELDEGHVASATIESVAENLTDSIVAPLIFYAFFDLYGAFAYRFVNTADAMLGYRGGRYESLGKAAARLDDLLNYIPARTAGLLIVLSAPFTGGDARGAFKAMRLQHGCTKSPNAGWTMAAMAGALGVVLEKIGCYTLGEGTLPSLSDIDRALQVMAAATFLFVGLCLFGLMVL